MPADPPAVAPVVPFVVFPVVAVLVPADDVDDADTLMELDVALTSGITALLLLGTAVLLLLEPAVVALLDAAVVAPCVVIDVVVWAWSAVVPSMSSAVVMVRDGLRFIWCSHLVTIGDAAVVRGPSITTTASGRRSHFAFSGRSQTHQLFELPIGPTLVP